MKSFARFFGIGAGEKENPKENITESISESSISEISAGEKRRLQVVRLNWNQLLIRVM